MANEKDWEIQHINIKTAYLNSDIDEEIYMEIPEGFMNNGIKTKVLHLRKAIYGLKQAGRQWYRKLREALKKFGLVQTSSDPHTFITHKVVDSINRTLILPVYVDNLLPIGDKVLTDDFKHWIPVTNVTLTGVRTCHEGRDEMMSPAGRLTTCLMHIGRTSDWHE